MKHYFGTINFDFYAEDETDAYVLQNAFIAMLQNHPAVCFAVAEDPEEDTQ